jgi:flagellar hook-basal body complex protein FliE
MSIESTGFIPVGADLAGLAGLEQAQLPRSDFGQWLDGRLGEINAGVQNADHLIQQLAVGEISNLHHVMMEVEKAKLTFELAVQLRNKALEAYQEVIRMQI